MPSIKWTRLLMVSLLAAVCAACGSVTKKMEFSQAQIEAEQVRQLESVVATELEQRQRLSSEVFRFALAAYPECGPLRSYVSGIELSGIGAIKESLHPGAKQIGFGMTPLVTVVAKDSPAALAGVRFGDELLGINSQRTWRDGQDSYLEASKLLAKVESAGQPFELSLRRQGKAVTLSIQPIQGCRINAAVVRSARPEPRANSNTVLFPYHMVKLAASPSELASIASFGVAAIIKRLGVPFNAEQARQFVMNRYDALTVKDDDLLKVSSVTVFQKEVEDADVYAVALMRRTGGDPKALVEFWRKLIIRNMLSEKDNWGRELTRLERMAKLELASK